MSPNSPITIVQEPDAGGSPKLVDEIGPSRLLETEDVARYIGMTADWVYREVRAGRMPHIRLGRYVRFRRESIDAWLVARERGAAAVRTRSR
jgi:excisionase family DNA binding protein